MIEYTYGNLLEADAEALVNTVNTVGVMGKGIALQFKKAFRKNHEAYVKACKKGDVTLGEMFVFQTGELVGPRYIINFPTKKHWRGKAKLSDIEAGLQDLVQVVRREKIRSIAVPPLGCGNGGLEWTDVKEKIEGALARVPEVRVLLYPPQQRPAAAKMKVATTLPNWTPARAALVLAFNRYLLPGYSLTLLEAQKLAYFLQVAGEPMKLTYARAKYGPYAEQLNHLLQRIEGHFIRGYGDRTAKASITVVPRAVKQAEEIVGYNRDTQAHLEAVSRLIEGFETPYGLELLSTVHWLAQENDRVKSDVNVAIDGVQSWNEAKRVKFQPDHVRIAWGRLREHRWI